MLEPLRHCLKLYSTQGGCLGNGNRAGNGSSNGIPGSGSGRPSTARWDIFSARRRRFSHCLGNERHPNSPRRQTWAARPRPHNTAIRDHPLPRRRTWRVRHRLVAGRQNLGNDSSKPGPDHTTGSGSSGQAPQALAWRHHCLPLRSSNQLKRPPPGSSKCLERPKPRSGPRSERPFSFYPFHTPFSPINQMYSVSK